MSGCRAWALAAMLAGCASLTPVPRDRADAMRAVPRGEPGQAVVSLKWKWTSADRRFEVAPQEFATPVVWGNTVYSGSARGDFVALRVQDGKLRWRKRLGSVSSAPLADRGYLYVGTDDGTLVCLDAQTGQEHWRYLSKGPIGQTPRIAGELLIFTNEADQIIALDALKGTLKWQYKADTPDDFTLRGHAAPTVDGNLVYVGFANGTLVALHHATGTVEWVASLKGDGEKFVDVDGTAVVDQDTLYVTSASGGAWALDKASGQIRWRVPLWDARDPQAVGNVGGLALDENAIFVGAADLGLYKLTRSGEIVWRIGAHGGGEPATPVISDMLPEFVAFALAKDGLFFIDKQTGKVAEFFDPGDGVSSGPTITRDGRVYVISNRGTLYAFELEL